MKAKSSCEMKNWEEEIFRKLSDQKKTARASAEFTMKGEIEGVADEEFLLYYKKYDDKDEAKGVASFQGLMMFDGKVGGKSGGFVLEDHGLYEAGTAKSTLKIVDDSGTGDLKGIRGTAVFQSTKDSASFELDYSL